jgi:hypothetical protein
MGNLKLYKLSDSAIGFDAINNADYSRGAHSNNSAEKHQRMNLLHILGWSIGLPAFVYSFWFGDINSEVDLYKNIVLAAIAIITGCALMWRQVLKAIKETVEFVKWLMPESKRRKF